MKTSLSIASTVFMAGLAFAGLAQAQQTPTSGQADPARTEARPGNADSMTPDSMAADRAGGRAMESKGTDAGTAAKQALAADRMFYEKALASGHGEVELSRYATTHAQSRDVKTLARRLVDHHTALNKKLMTTSGLQAAPKPKPEDAKAAAEVKANTGAAFDMAFLDHMAKGHAKSIALYEATGKQGKDASTRQLAKTALPTLRGHAKSIAALQTGGMAPAR